MTDRSALLCRLNRAGMEAVEAAADPSAAIYGQKLASTVLLSRVLVASIGYQ